eukprot:scaffold334_cov241-Pinguiococcus_pyrenoidosus.AAC.71
MPGAGQHLLPVPFVPREDRHAAAGVHVPQASALILAGTQQERGLQRMGSQAEHLIRVSLKNLPSPISSSTAHSCLARLAAQPSPSKVPYPCY